MEFVTGGAITIGKVDLSRFMEPGNTMKAGLEIQLCLGVKTMPQLSESSMILRSFIKSTTPYNDVFLKVIAAGMNPVQITRGIEKTAEALISELKLMSREVCLLLKHTENSWFQLNYSQSQCCPVANYLLWFITSLMLGKTLKF